MIIVTGGAGFIGSNLLAGLEEAGITDLVITDRMGMGDKWRNIAKRELRDIVPPANFLAYLENHKKEIEIIFHMGGNSSTTEQDADALVADNLSFSRTMWRWAAANGVRLVYASSVATYGDGTNGFVDDQSPAALAKLRPMNPYGWSKHSFDRSIAGIVEKKSEPVPSQWVGLKFFNVYGPNEYHKGDQRSVPSKLCPQVEAGAAVKLFKSTNPQYKDGEQQRDFVYVRDCVDIMIWLYQNKNVSGLFNVGCGKARSFNELAAAIFKAMNKPPKFQYIDMVPDLVARYQSFTQADVAKLRAAGYTKPFTDLESGIQDYVQQYLLTKDRYR